ncbi:MAG: phospho-N-acetylmuramoyl-pentapeptide-transferase [Clostridia bacterium]|nr:phospho-N-acetylmuramoyl-pentapeptide-transferase [Clostridia bacterium]
MTEYTKHTVVALAAFAIALGLSLILYKIFIPVLRKVKLGQKILDIGPNWHKCKEGTPTMGGLFFIVGMLVAVTICCFGTLTNPPYCLNVHGERVRDYRLHINLLLSVLTGAVGFIDDYVKLFKKRNKGLSAAQKMGFLIVTSLSYLLINNYFGYIDTRVNLPFIRGQVELGVLYYIIAVLVMVYFINCANLTDGIDGLAGSISCIIMTMFFTFAVFLDKPQMSVYTAAVLGGVIAFLAYNYYPARIFMGDTGSLFLGSAAVLMAFWTNASLLIFLIGLIYFIEGISVMLQVFYYKRTKKRLFKMAPIHHHFEMCGWSEWKIVGVFSAVTLVCCVAAYLILVLYLN